MGSKTLITSSKTQLFAICQDTILTLLQVCIYLVPRLPSVLHITVQPRPNGNLAVVRMVQNVMSPIPPYEPQDYLMQKLVKRSRKQIAIFRK